MSACERCDRGELVARAATSRGWMTLQHDVANSRKVICGASFEVCVCGDLRGHHDGDHGPCLTWQCSVRGAERCRGFVLAGPPALCVCGHRAEQHTIAIRDRDVPQCLGSGCDCDSYLPSEDDRAAPLTPLQPAAP